MLEILAVLGSVFLVASFASVLAFHFVLGVPPIPSSRRQRDNAILLLANTDLPDGATIYELGCGWGGLAVALARAFPQATVIGIEASPWPWLVANLRARRLDNLQVRRANFHAEDLRPADAVVCYLMIRPMTPLAEKLDRELRKDTPVVALTFWFRGRLPANADRKGPLVDAALFRWPAKAPDA